MPPAPTLARSPSPPSRGGFGVNPGWVHAHVLSLLLVAVSGCGDSPRDQGAATASGTGSSAGTATGAASAGEDGGSTTEGTKFDVGHGATAGADGGDASTCTNVDILFVIDDSGSMADQQQSLINSFSGFVAGMQQQLANAASYHVGVVTTDAYTYNEDGCQNLGDLVTKTGGGSSSNQDCKPFGTGLRYLDDSEPDLDAAFSCIAQVGVFGSDDEKIMRAMLNALKPGNNAPGACNEGFSRLDSLLVIVLVTDEDDVPEPYMCDPNDPFGPNPCETVGSGGDKDSWYAELLTYKANIPENIVVLSLIGRSADNACGAQVASKLFGFTNLFGEHGYVGDVCAGDYAPFFTDALPVIEQACQDYIPPEG